jgi:uncharacterized protein YbjT (DUF2867 family)
MREPVIVIVGATGNLGGRIVKELRARNCSVRAIVRPGTSVAKLNKLRAQHVDIATADLLSHTEMVRLCEGASCVISTLLGLHNVLVEAQGALLKSAVEAGVPRFIPSDFAMDFTKISPGLNRNFDLHREFRAQLEAAPIHSTIILNGAFMELLKGDAPIVLSNIKRVLWWGGNSKQLLDFTTIDNTAAFTAEAALDADAPPILRIAGEQIDAHRLAKVASEVSGKDFKLLHGGSLHRLKNIINLTRALTPKTDAPFPIWQGMQYIYCMFEGSGALQELDNQRYPNIHWTSVRDVLRETL